MYLSHRFIKKKKKNDKTHRKLLDEKKQFEKIAEELKEAEQELTGLLQTREVRLKRIHFFLSSVLLVGYRFTL